MSIARSFAVFLLLIHLITPSDCNEKIYDTYFNGHCYWTEEVSYHVHYSSGCKVYFTCQRGKFLDFHRCPESTVFNTNTLQCEANGVCKDETSINPTYETWWRTVVGVIDVVMEALEDSSTWKENSQPSTEASKKEQDASFTILPSSTIPSQMIFNTNDPSVGSSVSRESNQISVDAGDYSKIRGSVQLPTEAKSEELDSSTTIASTPILNTKQSHFTAKTPENELNSVHIVPMQFDTQSSLLTERFSSYVTPKALLQEGNSKTIDQLNLSDLEAFIFSSRSSKRHSFMNDFFLPMVQDILKNSTIMSKVSQLFDVVFESADPLVYKILDQQVDEKLGSSITISLKELKDAWNRTAFHAYPIVKDILRYTLSPVLERAADNIEVVLDFMDLVDDRIMNNSPSIFGTVLDLIFKYGLLNKPSVSDQFKTYSLTEIRNDKKSIFGILSNIFSDISN